MKISVIIPTLNAERWISRQLDSLFSQTIDAEKIVIDSGSTDATCSLVLAHADRVRLLKLPNEAFDHGGTRDYALRQSTGDIVCFLTQDALPTDERCLEKLLAAFSAPNVAAVYGRQIAYPDAPEYERLTRIFNYPDQPRVWREEDIPYYGVKSYFFSNVCSAYRREAYLAVGGFDTPILCNEDMMMAAKLLPQSCLSPQGRSSRKPVRVESSSTHASTPRTRQNTSAVGGCISWGANTSSRRSSSTSMALQQPIKAPCFSYMATATASSRCGAVSVTWRPTALMPP